VSNRQESAGAWRINPCKSAGLVEYRTFGETIDSRIQCECLGCPPIRTRKAGSAPGVSPACQRLRMNGRVLKRTKRALKFDYIQRIRSHDVFTKSDAIFAETVCPGAIICPFDKKTAVKHSEAGSGRKGGLALRLRHLLLPVTNIARRTPGPFDLILKKMEEAGDFTDRPCVPRWRTALRPMENRSRWRRPCGLCLCA